MDRSTQVIALVVIAAVCVLGLVLVFWFGSRSATPAHQPATFTKDQLVTAGSPMTGSASAKVTLVEWGDYECPFCGQEEPVVKQLIATYGKNPDFNFVFRNFPLPQHANARAAAEAAEAAGAQGKYWPMYEALYEHQNDWVNASNPRSFFDTYAKNIGLDVATFDKALDAHTYKPLVDADATAALNLGLDHTPTLFLNGAEQTDVSLTGLTKAIDTALKQ